ncbi:MAG: aspartate/glutamate racemase family protein [Proteobacteria bacterium]|nr:aspartate/glutamate racemase family protein [Pseudomonadota bacterium]
MRLLGLIGGTSWESTTHYYQLLNRLARERLGGKHSARLLLWSVDFAPIAALQEEGRWDALTDIMIDAATRLENAGAEGLLICANTMHSMADDIAAAIGVPLIHIADVTATALKLRDVRRPVLLATRFTMEQPFYRERLMRHGIEPIMPGEADRRELHRIIFEELVQGQFLPASRDKLADVVNRLRGDGADGVILGCTEFGMLAPPGTFDLPAVDTAEAHAEAAMEFALGGRR